MTPCGLLLSGPIEHASDVFERGPVRACPRYGSDASSPPGATAFGNRRRRRTGRISPTQPCSIKGECAISASTLPVDC
jgi:hypothetical protein